MDLNYRSLLIQLLPPGRIWEVSPGSTADKLIEGIAEVFTRIEHLSKFDPFPRFRTILRKNWNFNEASIHDALKNEGYENVRLIEDFDNAQIILVMHELDPALEKAVRAVIPAHLGLKVVIRAQN